MLGANHFFQQTCYAISSSFALLAAASLKRRFTIIIGDGSMIPSGGRKYGRGV